MSVVHSMPIKMGVAGVNEQVQGMISAEPLANSNLRRNSMGTGKLTMQKASPQVKTPALKTMASVSNTTTTEQSEPAEVVRDVLTEQVASKDELVVVNSTLNKVKHKVVKVVDKGDSLKAPKSVNRSSNGPMCNINSKVAT
ncbi:hypothetical protein V6N12_007303 [Hibiscus sabdariffa]|uniref:Uncharacterized protein n=1 Tax=Hibiscus sabdariffa TaxID=183260 RepID=A0ABR2F1D0_9ROSI